jgi:DHA1 family bicyclomycin/chloramphenicol resistance-like MFS transporter
MHLRFRNPRRIQVAPIGLTLRQFTSCAASACGLQCIRAKPACTASAAARPVRLLDKQRRIGSVESGAENQPRLAEFVALMAFTMSLVALSLDAMLPAFPDMSRDLRVMQANQIQLVVSFLFTGMAIGQLFYGSLSDAMGRKPAMYVGYCLFLAGCALCMAATQFHLMLAGRLLQGIGAAGPRTVAVALIRDRYHGPEMARVMSFILTVFVLVPVFAPALGQLILLISGWRAIFTALALLALMAMTWLATRQPETLPRAMRMPFTLRKVGAAFREVLGNRVVVVAMIIAGCVSGMFLGYLNASQQIFQVQYGLGRWFPLYFAILAIAVGCASLLNTGLVMRFGMHRLADLALSALMILSWLFLGLVWQHGGHPPLWLFMGSCLAMFFCIGLLFGNLNSIAMEPLGHVAGTAASVIGSSSTLLAVVLGYLIGHAFDGTLMPVALGFALLATLSRLLLLRVKSSWRAHPHH